MLAGGMVLVSFMLLYQDRMFGLLNVFALHAVVLSLSVSWQAYIQNAPHLYVTAAIALVLKAIIIPVALHRVVVRLGIHRTIETVGGIGAHHAVRDRARGPVDGRHAARDRRRRSARARGSGACAFGGAAWGC